MNLPRLKVFIHKSECHWCRDRDIQSWFSQDVWNWLAYVKSWDRLTAKKSCSRGVRVRKESDRCRPTRCQELDDHPPDRRDCTGFSNGRNLGKPPWEKYKVREVFEESAYPHSARSSFWVCKAMLFFHTVKNCWSQQEQVLIIFWQNSEAWADQTNS